MKTRKCPKLKKKTPEQIAKFLIKNYNKEKVPEIVKEFKEWGFNKEKLINDKRTLFKFLVLIAYDRQPFDRPNYYTVWDKGDPESVHNVLERNGLFNLAKIKQLSIQQIESLLRKCRAHGYHLHNTNPKNEKRGTKFARTIKQISEIIDEIKNLLLDTRTESDVLRLHRKLCTIHGIKGTIAAKFIMYTLREMRIGNVHPSKLEPIAFFLLGEAHNQKWAKRLENPEFGGRKGLLEQVMENLREDPLAIDYFWHLDKEYCSKGRCEECEL